MFGKDAEERGAVFQALYKTRVTVVKMLILVAALFALSWAPYFGMLLDEVSEPHRFLPLSSPSYFHFPHSSSFSLSSSSTSSSSQQRHSPPPPSPSSFFSYHHNHHHRHHHYHQHHQHHHSHHLVFVMNIIVMVLACRKSLPSRTWRTLRGG
jgi:hypothetical protein